MSSSVSITALLKKTEHYDKDERYMATSDLCEVLKRQSSTDGGGTSSSSMDTNTEQRICKAVLRLLHDKSNDVQAIAVKTLGVLISTVAEPQVLEIADRLGHAMMDLDKSELRDVYAIGLRTLVKTIPMEMGNAVAHRLVPRLLDGVRTTTTSSSGAAAKTSSSGGDAKEEIVLACLDVWMDLLGRFGATSPHLTRQQEPLLQSCLLLLTLSQPPVVRKRSGQTLGVLSVVLSDALLSRMVESLLSQIEQAEAPETPSTTSSQRRTRSQTAAAAAADAKPSATSSGTSSGDTRALIRTMCTISGAVGHRLTQTQMDRVIPIFLSFCLAKDAITGDDDNGGDADMESQDEMDEDNNNGDDDMDDVDDDDDDDDEEQDEAAIAMANELRESCFMGFESFVSKCPLPMLEPHLDFILQAALAYMSYDPNYSYGMEDQDDEFGDEYDDDGYDDEDDELLEDDDDDDDDDDDSWKVRRAAIRSIMAVVSASTRSHVLLRRLWHHTYDVRLSLKTTVASALVDRFKEREEHCRVDVIDCFAKLLQVTVQNASDPNGKVKFAKTTTTTSAGGGEAMEEDDSILVIDLRTTFGPAVVKACEQLLAVPKKKSGYGGGGGGASMKSSSEKSKSSALSLLSILSQAPGGVGGETEVHSVFTHVKSFLGQSGGQQQQGGAGGKTTTTTTQDNKTLQLDALKLIRVMLGSGQHDAAHVASGLETILLADICSAVQEQWYKVISEALRVLTQVPPFFATMTSDNEKARATKVASQLYDAIQPLLGASDVDQEIKECALGATVALLSNLHMCLSAEKCETILGLLLDKLKNETTRIAAIKTLSAIADNGGGDEDDAMEDDTTTPKPPKMDLSPILGDAILCMGTYLKQQSRQLKQSSLEALDVVIVHHGEANLSVDIYNSVLSELSSLLVDTDLHLCQLAMRVYTSILKVVAGGADGAAVAKSVHEHVLEPVLNLSTSPHLQDGATLDALLALLEQMILSSAMEFNELLGMLQGKASVSSSGAEAASSDTTSPSKHGLAHLAKCIATITIATTPDNRSKVVKDLLATLGAADALSSANLDTQRRVTLSFLVTGDVGRVINYATVGPDVVSKLQTYYLGAFDASPSEEVKQAAAYALGRSAIGAQDILLPSIVDALEKQADDEKKKYLLLVALKEFIQCQQKMAADASSSSSVILPHLLKHTSDSDEGARTIVAECMGSLTCVDPAMMLPRLQELQKQHTSITSEAGQVADDDATSKTNALVCTTVANAVKYAFAHITKSESSSSLMESAMPTFLELLKVEEVGVRNAALLMVYSAVHHMPQVVAPYMTDMIMPTLVEVMDLKLKRVVDLGPFKHTVDDALPLRKSSMSIFTTCLEKLPTLDLTTFTTVVLPKALRDVEDVQLQAHHVILTMCGRVNEQTYLMQAMDALIPPLEEQLSDKIVKKKTNNKTGTELERAKEWIKSGLRALMTLHKMMLETSGGARGGAAPSPKLTTLVERVKTNVKLRPMLDALEDER